MKIPHPSAADIRPIPDIGTIDTLLSAWTPSNPDVTSSEAQVIDLFSGCGGMSLGFAAVARAYGAYRLVGAADIDNISLATYRQNFGVPALSADVRKLASEPKALDDFLHALPDYDSRRPLVLIGCAPCQGFTAHRKKRWAEVDLRNGLVDAFAEVAIALSPECVVMENVPELFSDRYWEHFEYLRHRLKNAGYIVKQAIYNAATFGAPQERFRALVIAMKCQSFSMPRPSLDPSVFRTVRDAIGDLPAVSAGEELDGDRMHKSANHRRSTLDIIRAVPKDGGSRPTGVGPDCLDRVKGFSDVYGRLPWDKPAITITHYARNPASGRFTHPDQDRGMTMREAARLQGFPDTFDFTGAFDHVFRQIGEAVSPPFATAVALTVLSNLRGLPSDETDQLITAPVSDSYASVIAGIKAKRR